MPACPLPPAPRLALARSVSTVGGGGVGEELEVLASIYPDEVKGLRVRLGQVADGDDDITATLVEEKVAPADAAAGPASDLPVLVSHDDDEDVPALPLPKTTADGGPGAAPPALPTEKGQAAPQSAPMPVWARFVQPDENMAAFVRCREVLVRLQVNGNRHSIAHLAAPARYLLQRLGGHPKSLNLPMTTTTSSRLVVATATWQAVFPDDVPPDAVASSFGSLAAQFQDMETSHVWDSQLPEASSEATKQLVMAAFSALPEQVASRLVVAIRPAGSTGGSLSGELAARFASALSLAQLVQALWSAMELALPGSAGPLPSDDGERTAVVRVSLPAQYPDAAPRLLLDLPTSAWEDADVAAGAKVADSSDSGLPAALVRDVERHLAERAHELRGEPMLHELLLCLGEHLDASAYPRMVQVLLLTISRGFGGVVAREWTPIITALSKVQSSCSSAEELKLSQLLPVHPDEPALAAARKYVQQVARPDEAAAAAGTEHTAQPAEEHVHTLAHVMATRNLFLRPLLHCGDLRRIECLLVLYRAALTKLLSAGGVEEADAATATVFLACFPTLATMFDTASEYPLPTTAKLSRPVQVAAKLPSVWEHFGCPWQELDPTFFLGPLSAVLRQLRGKFAVLRVHNVMRSDLAVRFMEVWQAFQVLYGLDSDYARVSTGFLPLTLAEAATVSRRGLAGTPTAEDYYYDPNFYWKANVCAAADCAASLCTEQSSTPVDKSGPGQQSYAPDLHILVTANLRGRWPTGAPSCENWADSQFRPPTGKRLEALQALRAQAHIGADVGLRLPERTITRSTRRSAAYDSTVTTKHGTYPMGQRTSLDSSSGHVWSIPSPSQVLPCFVLQLVPLYLAHTVPWTLNNGVMFGISTGGSLLKLNRDRLDGGGALNPEARAARRAALAAARCKNAHFFLGNMAGRSVEVATYSDEEDDDDFTWYGMGESYVATEGAVREDDSDVTRPLESDGWATTADEVVATSSVTEQALAAAPRPSWLPAQPPARHLRPKRPTTAEAAALAAPVGGLPVRSRQPPSRRSPFGEGAQPGSVDSDLLAAVRANLHGDGGDAARPAANPAAARVAAYLAARDGGDEVSVSYKRLRELESKRVALQQRSKEDILAEVAALRAKAAAMSGGTSRPKPRGRR